MKKALLTFIMTIVLCFTLLPSGSYAKTFPDVDPNTSLGMAVSKLSTLGIVNGKPNGNYAPNDSVTRAEAAKIMFGILELAPYANETDELRFKDLPPTFWAYKEIMTMSDWDYLNGFPDNTFQPNSPLTRGQMAAILYNTLKLSPGSSSLPFTDVKKEAFYYAGVAALYKNGITYGRSETKFEPNASVTRGELALFLDRSKVLDELLQLEQVFPILDFEKVNGKAISEAEFQQLHTKFEKDIWSIDSSSISSEAYFNDATKTFENLSESTTTYFDIQFIELDTPVYLKIVVSEEGVKSFYIKTPAYLKEQAAKQTGSLALQAKIRQILQQTGIQDEAYLPTYFHVSSGDAYVSYLGNALYYIEFLSDEPIILEYDFLTIPLLGELTLTPSRSTNGYDFKVE